MDEDIAELVDQLCTRAGMIMEDASTIALTMRQHRDAAGLKDAIHQLAKTASTIGALLNAAQQLMAD